MKSINNKKLSYLVYVGGGKSSLQTWGHKNHLFKKNTVYPEPFETEFINHLFFNLPEQFRMATPEEVKKLFPDPSNISSEPPQTDKPKRRAGRPFKKDKP